jgi:Tim44-like domain
VRRRRLIRISLLAGACVVLAACVAVARPGGGQSYRGGSARSSGNTRYYSPGSGQSGGGGDVNSGLVLQVLFLCFRYPPLGLLVVTGVVGYAIVANRRGRALSDWSVGGTPARVEAATRTQSARSELARVVATDPGFSLVLFEDFAYALYAEVEVSRAQGGIGRLSAFLSPAVASLLYDPALGRVDGVVIGAMRYLAVEVGPERTQVTLEIEANLTETRGAGAQRYYVCDRLVLTRSATARSRPPGRTRKLDCPNCGAPLEGMRGTTCAYCHQEVGGGRLDWLLKRIDRVTTESQPPAITKDAPESGNQLPTLVSPGVEARLAELTARDPATDLGSQWARLGLVFSELQVGWSTRDLSRIRPFVTDNLFQYFGYWIDVYVSAHAYNVTENARILNIELVDVLADAVYDAVTVRLFATSLDYTLAEDGQLLSGNRSRERQYSEYWTLIRGHGVRGRPRAEPACPSCGAPLKIAMAGNCEYCHARVVSGEFDWVLSRIEQDEAYGG